MASAEMVDRGCIPDLSVEVLRSYVMIVDGSAAIAFLPGALGAPLLAATAAASTAAAVLIALSVTLRHDPASLLLRLVQTGQALCQ